MSGNDIEIARDDAVSSALDAKAAWCKMMAPGDILPAQFRGKPANLLFAIEWADAVGVSRIQALTSITVINGRPAPMSDLMATLVRKAGHRLRVAATDTEATATLVRADDPDFEYRVTWNVERAKTAGLWGNKGPWTNYPAAMLRSRAVSEVIRQGAPDCLAGAIYTPDEAHDMAPPVRAHAERITAAELISGPAAPAETAADVSDWQPADPPQPAQTGSTEQQVKKIAVMLDQLGVKDRTGKLTYLTELFGRDFTSSKELTKTEASQVIEDLQGQIAAEAQP